MQDVDVELQQLCGCEELGRGDDCAVARADGEVGEDALMGEQTILSVGGDGELDALFAQGVWEGVGIELRMVAHLSGDEALI